MRRFLGAILVGVLVLGVPVLTFAQSDGGAEEPTKPPAEEAPKETPAETPTPAEPPAPTPETPTPTTESTPETTPTPTPTPAAPTAVTTAAPTPAAPTPIPEVPLEEVQEVLELAAKNAPAQLKPWLSALAGAVGAIVATLGVQALAKKVGQKGKKPCKCCGGGGYEHGVGLCLGCKGTRLVEEEHAVEAKCPHCGGTGEEPCEICKGEGAKDGKACQPCQGTGVKRDKDGKAERCTTCFGKGKAAVTLKRQKPCPDCSGAP